MQIELSRRVVQLCIAILALIALSMLGTYYVDWLWFESIGYNSVFLTMLFSEWAVYLTVFAFSFLLIAYNLDYARKNMPPSGDDSRAYEQEDDVNLFASGSFSVDPVYGRSFDALEPAGFSPG